MPDSEPDLYSFLRSKDFTDEEEDAASEPDSADSSVQTVDSFDAPDPGDNAVQDTFGHNFDDDDLVEALADLSEEALDQAPFGIVRVDDEGVVEFYNQYESELAGVDPDDAVGRNFFTQLAPCSSNRLFHGRFKKGVRSGTLDERFTYTFTYKMSPTLVQVRMHRDSKGNNWILIRKRT
jgi:photoactive yellow protein